MLFSSGIMIVNNMYWLLNSQHGNRFKRKQHFEKKNVCLNITNTLFSLARSRIEPSCDFCSVFIYLFCCCYCYFAHFTDSHSTCYSFYFYTLFLFPHLISNLYMVFFCCRFFLCSWCDASFSQIMLCYHQFHWIKN